MIIAYHCLVGAWCEAFYICLSIFLMGNSLKISHKYNVNLLELIVET